MASKTRYERITITLPIDVIAGMKSVATNRSSFLARAARREIKREQRKAFLASLDTREMTPEDRALERASHRDLSVQSALLEDDVEAMIDPSAFEAVEWVPGKGWAK